MTTFQRLPSRVLGLLLAFAPIAAFAQFVGDSEFACNDLSGSNCSVAIPDGADPAQAMVEASFTIPQGTPVCPFAAVSARVVVLHSATNDLEITLTHAESGTSINVPASGGEFGNMYWNDRVLNLPTPANIDTGVAGVWSVQIEDHYASDYGALADFRVIIDCAIPKAIVSESGTIPDVAEPGETLGYSIELSNDTDLPMQVRVRDPLPAGTAFVAADNGGNLVGSEVVWDPLDIPANTTLTIGFSVEVESPLAAGRIEIANQATIEGLSDNVLGGSDVSCAPGTGAGAGACLATVIPTAATLERTQKTIAAEDGATAGLAEPGELLTYDIVLRNDDGIDISGVDAVDPLPPGTAFVSASDGGVLVGNQVEWAGLTVPAQGELTLQLQVRVLDDVPDGVVSIINQASVNGTSSCADVADPNICNPTTLPLGNDVGPGLKEIVSESGSIAGVAEPGEQIGYRITLTNTGALDASGIEVIDPIPVGTTFVSASAGGTLDGDAVVWPAVTVPGAGSVSLDVVVQVVAPIPLGLDAISNQATAAGVPTCADLADPGVCEPTTLPTLPPTPAEVGPGLKQIVSESGEIADLAEPGELIGYSITLTNTGELDATGIDVVDPLPAGTNFVSADSGGVFAGGSVTWPDVTVPAGGSVSLGLVLRVDDPVPAGLDSISNQALANGVPTCASLADPDVCEATSLPLQPGTVVPAAPAVIPTLAPQGLLALLLAFALLAGLRLGRRD